MPSITYTDEPEQAPKLPNGVSHKQEEEDVEQLRVRLQEVQRDLSIMTAERDHLRAQTTRKEEQARRYQLETPSLDNARPQFSKLRGQSKATRVSDSRIGKPRKILVVGGGPAGLITLHELLNPFNRPHGEGLDEHHIELYERRANVGGVWYFEPENDIAKGWHHGAAGLRLQEELRLQGDHPSKGVLSDGHSTLPDKQEANTEEETHINGCGSAGKATTGHTDDNGYLHSRQDSGYNEDFCWLAHPQTAPRWPSPAYEGLVGNVLPPLLEFSAERFPRPDGGMFPSMTETHKYLLNLAGPLRSHIRTCREVVRIRPVFSLDSERPKWQVTSVDWTQRGEGVTTTEEWDAVIIAAGAFDHPYWPTIPGLARLREKKSPLVMHAKTYPGPRPFVNQHNKFVVVGNANSANDIAAHLAPLNSSGPLYRCIRHESNFAHLADHRIKDVPPIASIKEDRNTLSLTLTDGTTVDGVTKLIFASGYQFAFDWLTVPSIKDGQRETFVPSSLHGAVPNLHNATFHAVAPTLAFIGLSTGSTPMPLAEIQARITARTFHGLLKLPPTKQAMLATYLERAEQVGVSLDDPDREIEKWRTLHMIRGPVERVLTQRLLDELEASEEGASAGLFRWDDWREGIIKTMRSVKEGELRRLREAKVAAGGVDGGPGGILSHGLPVGQEINPFVGETSADSSGKSLLL